MRKIRFSITCMMILFGIVAVDFAVLRAISSVRTQSAQDALRWSLPLATILAVYLMIVVSRLRNRGEVAVSQIVFLFVGGSELLILIYVAYLAPYFFYMWVEPAPGLLPRLYVSYVEKTAIAQGPLSRVVVGLISAFLHFAISTILLLLPAMLAGWATRNDRLRILKAQRAEGDQGCAMSYEQGE
jgi:hypothetical protein